MLVCDAREWPNLRPFLPVFLLLRHFAEKNGAALSDKPLQFI
jgi:hypothetical protein